MTTSGGFTGISLAGTWECGSCGATGDGWYNAQDEELVLHDENGEAFAPDDVLAAVQRQITLESP